MSELVSCHYNRNHKVKRSRLLIHESKCPDKFSSKLLICPFNQVHKISEENLEKHKLICPDRPKIDEGVMREMKEYIKNQQGNKDAPSPISYQKNNFTHPPSVNQFTIFNNNNKDNFNAEGDKKDISNQKNKKPEKEKDEKNAENKDINFKKINNEEIFNINMITGVEDYDDYDDDFLDEKDNN